MCSDRRGKGLKLPRTKPSRQITPDKTLRTKATFSFHLKMKFSYKTRQHFAGEENRMTSVGSNSFWTTEFYYQHGLKEPHCKETEKLMTNKIGVLSVLEEMLNLE